MITKEQFIAANKIVLEYCKQMIKEPRPTKKMIETEMYVDAVIETTGKPPTYKQVAKIFDLKGTSAAYKRLRRYRHKMRSKQNLTKTG